MSSPTTAIIRNEARLFSREPVAVFWMLAFPSILLAGLGLIPSFREPDPNLGGQSVIELYVQVVVLLSMIFSGAQAMPEFLISYRQRKVLRRLRTTPLGPSRVILAQVVVHAAVVSLAALLCLLVGRVAFGTPLPEAPVGYALVYLLALASMMAVGAVISAVAPNATVANVLSMAVMFSFMFTAGVYLPVQAMPDALQTIVSFFPMGAAAEALNQAVLGEVPDLIHLGVMAAWTAALSLIAVRAFRWE
ncbi:ABC transporter permease [Nocardioides insulae]|uniref:ABC transporter permease n=1 Tax=Nocardioides insulae TaxID=394734 RepID=UPI000420671F|nr:ABC transporter permease [Nocardioides insulae]